MHPNAPFKHLQHHRPAVSAVMFGKNKAAPNAEKVDLELAQRAGFITFKEYPVTMKGWPKGEWAVTPRGADLLTDY